MFSNRGCPLGLNLKTNPLRNSLYSEYYSDEFTAPSPPESVFRITDDNGRRDTDDNNNNRVTD